MPKNKKVKIYQVGDDDHTSYPRSSARKKANSKANLKWDAELFSTRIEIPNNVLNGFIAMNLKYDGDKITIRTENVQRIEFLDMEEHFNTLKNSKLTSDETFYKLFATAVGQHDFIVKGYLTWSLRHEFQKPTEVVMYPDCNSDVSVSPLKICFCQLIRSMIIIFKFGRIAQLNAKLYNVQNLFVLNMALLEYSLVLQFMEEDF